MATSLQRNQNRTRPKKAHGKKEKRRRDQKKRLVALGMPEADVAKLTSREVLDLLKRPKKVEEEWADKKD